MIISCIIVDDEPLARDVLVKYISDYLVKPFSFERFMKAVNKAAERFKIRDRKNGTKDINETGKFIIKADGKLFQIEWKDISFFEAMGDYIKVHTSTRIIITHCTLKNIEDRLPAGMFLKVHRSYIISPSSIEFIEGNRIKIGKEFIPIGQSYRSNLEAYLAGR